MRFGVRDDFIQDILHNFQGYRTRFARDVKEMNAFVEANGLPPVVSLVLDQQPEQGGGNELVAHAERYMKDAGMQVVPANYRDARPGDRWRVSPWEGHPNEIANRLFAKELEPVIEQTPALWAYRR